MRELEPGRSRLGLRLGGRLLRLGAAVAVGVLVAHRVEARLERRHQVGNLLLLLVGRRLHGDLLAGRLALDEVEDLLAVGVVVLVGLERSRERLDELLGDVELALGDVDVGRGRDLVDAVGLDDLVGEEHRRHAQDVIVHRAQGDERLLGADDHPRDGDAAGLAHGLDEQPVGLCSAGPRREVIGVVVEDRVDLRELDEVLDLDGLGLLGLQRLELAGLDDHVAVGRELEALDDLVVGDLVARRRVDALLGDAHAGLAAELVETHGLAVDRAVELDRDGDQSERDRPGPNRTRHRSQVSPMRAAIPPDAWGIALPRLRRGAARGLRGVLRGGPPRTPRRSWRRRPAGRRGCGWSRGPRRRPPPRRPSWPPRCAGPSATRATRSRCGCARRRPPRGSRGRDRSRRPAFRRRRRRVRRPSRRSPRAGSRGWRRRRAPRARRSRRRRRPPPPCRP